MGITREKNALDKKWTWFLFLGANIMVLLGCGITWALIKNGNASSNYLGMLICNLVALVLAGVFVYFELKDVSPKIMHFQRKWLKFYILAFALFVIANLYSILYYLLFLSRVDFDYLHTHPLNWEFWVYFIITMVITLVSIGFQRYARFRIDLDIYKRKRGENPNKPEEKTESKPEDKKPSENIKKTPEVKDKKSGATGGLLDQM